MKIYHTIPDNKNLFKNPVVTIGNFDGVHIGHRKIFNKLLEVAQRIKGDPVVITFSSHPRKVLNPETPIKIVTTSDEKINAIFSLGIDNIILLHFTPEMANMTAREFYNDILVTRIDVRELVIGYDHAFGKNREGDIDYVSMLSRESNIGLTRVNEELYDSQPVSSTWIRRELESGNIGMVEKLLGRKYSITGTVMQGKGRGRSLGFPTANIVPEDPDKLIPADGTYSVMVSLVNGSKKKGMLNIGMNPTFSDTGRTIEAHLFDFNDDIYDARIAVEFVRFIRKEQAFGSVDKLSAQLQRDKETALMHLRDYE